MCSASIHSLHMLISFPEASQALRVVCGFPCQVAFPGSCFYGGTKGNIRNCPLKPVTVFTVRMLLRKLSIIFLFMRTQGRHFPLVLLSIRFDFYLMAVVNHMSGFVSHLMSLSEFWGLRTYISVPILPLAPQYLNYLNFFLYLDFIIYFLLIASYLIRCIYVHHPKISQQQGGHKK